MTVETFTLFFALLAGLAVLITVAIVVSLLSRDRFGVLAMVRPVALELAAAVAVTATLGSLYLSEVANYDPCRLCWVQRGFMYPGAILLPVSLLARRAGRSWASKPAIVAAVLAAIGLPVSIFHRIDQASGGIGSFCELDNPCSSRWVDHFGFVTIPTMAGAGFAAIVALVAITVRQDVQHRAEAEAPMPSAADSRR